MAKFDELNRQVFDHVTKASNRGDTLRQMMAEQVRLEQERIKKNPLENDGEDEIFLDDGDDLEDGIDKLTDAELDYYLISAEKKLRAELKAKGKADPLGNPPPQQPASLVQPPAIPPVQSQTLAP